MRIGILVFDNPENSLEPQHFVSKAMADKFLSYRPNGKVAVVKVHDFLLKIVANITFQKLKSLFRHAERDTLPRPEQALESQIFLRDLRKSRMPRASLPGVKAEGPVVEKSRSLRFWIMAANKIPKVCAMRDLERLDQRSHPAY